MHTSRRSTPFLGAPIRSAPSLLSGPVDCNAGCSDPLPRVPQVDHVIPWSYHPADDLFNLVLTDPKCNIDKRDRLVTAEFIERWLDRDSNQLQSLAAETRWPFEPTRSLRVARSAYRYLPEGFPVWAGYRSMQLFDEAQRSGVARALAAH